MAKLNWDATGERFYHAGVDRGVLYPPVGPGLVWNGLTSISEKDNTSLSEKYLDGKKYVTKQLSDSFSATVTAYTYPSELDDLETFNFSYRTMMGNDVDGLGDGYQIHIVYNALATWSGMNHKTLSRSLDPLIFSWEVTTSPAELNGTRGSHLIIDSRLAYPWALEEIERVLYGTSSTEPSLPSAQDIWDIFEDSSILKIIDHGDGTWTADGPDEAIVILGDGSFEITWPSAIWLDDDTYKISSL